LILPISESVIIPSVLQSYEEMKINNNRKQVKKKMSRFKGDEVRNLGIT
jgi:hypothetical protein